MSEHFEITNARYAKGMAAVRPPGWAHKIEV